MDLHPYGKDRGFERKKSLANKTIDSYKTSYFNAIVHCSLFTVHCQLLTASNKISLKVKTNFILL